MTQGERSRGALQKSSRTAYRPAYAGRQVFHALRRQPLRARGLKRVMDVLDACEKLLLTRRVEDLTIEEIACEAKITPGSLYHFFPDRTSIFVSVLERILLAEVNAFRPRPSDGKLSFQEYLVEVERRLGALWNPRLGLMDLYFAFQHHPIVWAAVLNDRAQVARDLAVKLRSLYPRLSVSRATAVGEQIGVVIAVLVNNLAYVEPAQQRRLRRECRAMLTSYVNDAQRGSRSAVCRSSLG